MTRWLLRGKHRARGPILAPAILWLLGVLILIAYLAAHPIPDVIELQAS